MSSLFIYEKNIADESTRRYYPASAHKLSEDRITVAVRSDQEALLTLCLDAIDLNNTQLIPALSVAAQSSYGYQCRLGVLEGRTAVVRETALSAVGGYPPAAPAQPAEAGGVEARIDTFVLRDIQGRAHVTFNLYSDNVAALLRRPLLLALSVSPDGVQHRVTQASFDRRHDIPVPAKSQMAYAPDLQKRICSPTCLSMVLDYFGKKTEVPDVAQRAYHAGHDLYGVWPSNIWAASRYGCLGYIHRLAGFDDAKQLLDDNIPLIASIRYSAGELAGAAIRETSGHLVVVRGYRQDGIIVNDPAAPDAASVCRVYNLKEFLQVWLERTGVAYVLIPVS